MILGWCSTGHHEACRRSVDVFYLDPKGKVVYTGEKHTCECPKRGCACYVKRADRTKAKTRKRKNT